MAINPARMTIIILLVGELFYILHFTLVRSDLFTKVFQKGIYIYIFARYDLYEKMETRIIYCIWLFIYSRVNIVRKPNHAGFRKHVH